MDYSKLLAEVKTVEDRDRLYSEIELVLEAIYKEGELEKVLDARISKTLRGYIGTETSTEILSQKILDLKNILNDLLVVKLTIAFEPSEGTIEKIVNFLRDQLGEKTIVEIRQEPSILGGVILEFKGLYKDYTLKTKLDEVFRTKREEIFRSMNQEARIKGDESMIHNS